MKKGRVAYLAYVKEAKEESPRLEDICVVQKYPDVFPDDLSRLLSEREVEFIIELLSGTELISIPPYWMALVVLKELKEQLHDLLNCRVLA